MYFGAATSVCKTMREGQLGEKTQKIWCGSQVNHWTSVRRLATRYQRLDCRDQSYRLDKCGAEARSLRSAALVERHSTSSPTH